MKSKNRPDCYKCKSGNVIPIVYGFPGTELIKDADEGKVHLGGCCITNNDPKWYCKDCENEW